MTDVQFIYIRGGDKIAPAVAAAAAIPYGVRHDATAYDRVYMLDVNWKKIKTPTDWQRYLGLVELHKPELALVPDFESFGQNDTLQGQINDLRGLVGDILVCPKFDGAMPFIPDFCRVAVSVPAKSYAGWIPPDLGILRGRRIHLLGGSPKRQIDLLTRLNGIGASVVSADGSYLAMKAGYGQHYYAGRWIDERGRGIPTLTLMIMSCREIVKNLNGAANWKQPPLI